MSVLIKSMEMPKSCGDCKAFVCYRQWSGDDGDCFCGITKKDAKANALNADCPLVPARPEVIRCKECKYADEYYRCPYTTWWGRFDDFCSRAERRTDG